MKCPICPTATLVMSERSGIEVDYCPACRGVWLDRGELDKIIAKTAADESDAPATRPVQQQQQQPFPQAHSQPQPQPHPQQGFDRRHRDDNDDSKYGYQPQWDSKGRPYKKKSLLKELFDF